MFMNPGGLFLLFMVPLLSMLITVLSRTIYHLYQSSKIGSREIH